MGFHVTIRCNYDENNILSFIRLIQDFFATCSENKHLISFDFQRIWQAKITKPLSDNLEVVKKHLADLFYPSKSMIRRRSGSFCYADFEQSIVINYDGRLYKCTAKDFDAENSIGTLNIDGKLNIHDRKYSYLNRILASCKTCVLFPICTVCNENRIDLQQNTTTKCPIDITETDKKLQISHRFEALFNNRIKRICDTL